MNKAIWYIDGTKEMFEGYDYKFPLFDEEQMEVVVMKYGLKLDENDCYNDRPNEIIARPIIIDNNKYYVCSMDWLWCKYKIEE